MCKLLQKIILKKNTFLGENFVFQKLFKNIFEKFQKKFQKCSQYFLKIFKNSKTKFVIIFKKIFFHQEKNIFFQNYFGKHLSCTSRCRPQNFISKPLLALKLRTWQLGGLLFADTVFESHKEHCIVL